MTGQPMLEPSAEGRERIKYTDPHPTWKPGDGSDRHPQTVEAWNWHDDPGGKGIEYSIKRLNVACDYADPRAPDQMALVLRIDLSRALGDNTHKNAFFWSWREGYSNSQRQKIDAEKAELRAEERRGVEKSARLH